MADRFEELSPADVSGAEDRLLLDGEAALVTGAASGIGRVVAFLFAARGCDVVVTDRQGDALEEVADEAREAFDISVVAIEADLADPEAVSDLVAEAVDAAGGLDVLLNVAGVSIPSASCRMETKTWDIVNDVDLRGTFLTAREAYPYLRNGGRIVNISSIAGIYGSDTMSHYAAAKAGVRNLTRSLAGEWADDDIRVNAVAPGPILTRGVADWFDVDPETAYDRATVSRDLGSPAEIADAVLFLASPLSSFVTGETLVVGGRPATQEDVSAAPR